MGFDDERGDGGAGSLGAGRDRRAGAARRGGSSPAERVPTIRVDAAKVDRMLDAVGETVLHHRRLEHALGTPP